MNYQKKFNTIYKSTFIFYLRIMNRLNRKEYNKKIGIYCIRNNKNNKIYIGSSNNLYKRINDHISSLERNIHCNKHLQNSYNINKEHFIVEVLSVFDDIEKVKIYEPLLIKLFEAYKQKYGYNILIQYKGTNGIKFSEERCKKISESNKGRIASNKGIPMTDEQKLLLQEVGKKRGKPILIYDLNNEFIEEHPTIYSVIRKYNLDKRSTQRVLTGKYKQTKGLILRYKG